MAPLGNQAVNGENKHQPDVSEETGLLDSIQFNYQLSIQFNGPQDHGGLCLSQAMDIGEDNDQMRSDEQYRDLR